MNTTDNRIKHFDYMRLTSLGIIGALVKVLIKYFFSNFPINYVRT